MNIGQATIDAGRGAHSGANAAAVRAAGFPEDDALAHAVHPKLGARGFAALACAMGGVFRDTVYVTLDALSGRYDR